MRKILNYTTQISCEKTVMEIQKMLVAAKAEAVMSEYKDGILSALSFRIMTPCGLLTFRMPANVDRIYKVLVAQKVTPMLRTEAQASRVAWRILKDWLAAQLALVQSGMVEFEQVMLPFVQDHTGAPLYERLKDRQFDVLALPPPA